MSHLDHSEIPGAYRAYIGRKIGLIFLLSALCGLLLVAAVSLGAVPVPLADALRALCGGETTAQWRTIVRDIRLPHALAALLAGAGLAVAGAAMQSVLRNPLGSPFTLGLSQAAAFGAAFAVMRMGAGTMQSTAANAVTILQPGLTTGAAFLASMAAALIIVAIARTRGATPEVMVLCGVALGSLFAAATMFLQYFADDTQLAAMVFWTFGDVGRAGWREVWIMAATVCAGALFFVLNRWNYNAIDAGDETASSLGVRVERVRMSGMLVSSAMAAVVVSFLGIIGFVGLIGPHIVRRMIGNDHRFLLPAAGLTGGALLLAADTAARLVLAPHVLPVSVLTAFLGAPAFLYLLLRKRKTGC
jgi:iron complex transport system permease protein